MISSQDLKLPCAIIAMLGGRLSNSEALSLALYLGAWGKRS